MTTSFFNKGLRARTLGLFLAIFATLWVLSPPVHAQNMTVGTISPALGLVFNGKSSMAGIAVGENFGGDGKGTVSTYVDGGIKLGVDAKLTGSNDPLCKIDCSKSTSTLSAVGEMIAGGRVTNQGVGFKPVTSQMGLNNMMTGEVTLTWAPMPKPVPTPLPAVKP